jgi:aminoglycoside phosphotransferase (APT) family kinase protein
VSAPATAAAPVSDATALRACLEDRVVPRLLGRRRPVTSVERKPALTIGSYECYVVSAGLAGGRTLQLFLKDYGTSRRPRRDRRARRERELGVYRELLPGAGLATARHLGEVWDEEAGRHWLLLELVAGPVVRDLDLEHWTLPLEWLGRMHARFAGAWDRSPPPAFLASHEERFFRGRADEALAAVLRCAPRLGRRMESVRERFESVLPVLAAGSRTLVHGAFVAANVIVAATEPPRICAVDWELAGVGSPFYDLACFCDGFEAPIRDRMLAAYRRGAGAGGLALPPEPEVIEAIDRFRLQRVMDWLAVAAEKRYSDDGIERLVSRGERLSATPEARP